MIKVLHIGAGNIGRGFIAPILMNSKQIGKFIFADINKEMVSYLEKIKNYNVIECDNDIKNKTNIKIDNAILIEQIKNNKKILSDINLITISIGKNNIEKIIDQLEIVVENNVNKNVIIMCCENGYKISSLLKEKMKNFKKLHKINFVDCLVDRIVPIQNNKEAVLVEKYYSWICDENQWPLDVERISTISYTDDIEYEIYKKMCLLNGLHCGLSWYRYSIDRFNNLKYTTEIINSSDTLWYLEEYVKEVSIIISHKFNKNTNDIIEYGQTIINRIQNKLIMDEFSRIGRNPLQKLQYNERIISPIIYAIENNLNYDILLQTLKNGINYYFKNEVESQKLKQILIENNLKWLINSLTKNENITNKILSTY